MLLGAIKRQFFFHITNSNLFNIKQETETTYVKVHTLARKHRAQSWLFVGGGVRSVQQSHTRELQIRKIYI